MCQARETGENGLRLDAVGNFISSTVLTVPKLLDCIGRKDTSGIQALMTDEGVAIFAKADAAALIERLSPNSPWKKSVR